MSTVKPDFYTWDLLSTTLVFITLLIPLQYFLLNYIVERIYDHRDKKIFGDKLTPSEKFSLLGYYYFADVLISEIVIISLAFLSFYNCLRLPDKLDRLLFSSGVIVFVGFLLWFLWFRTRRKAELKKHYNSSRCSPNAKGFTTKAILSAFMVLTLPLSPLLIIWENCNCDRETVFITIYITASLFYWFLLPFIWAPVNVFLKKYIVHER